MRDNSSQNYSLGLITFSLIPHSEVWKRTFGFGHHYIEQ